MRDPKRYVLLGLIPVMVYRAKKHNTYMIHFMLILCCASYTRIHRKGTPKVSTTPTVLHMFFTGNARKL